MRWIVMELWARDLMAVQEGGAPFEAPDELARPAPVEARRRERLLRAVMRARQQLFSNVCVEPGARNAMYFEL